MKKFNILWCKNTIYGIFNAYLQKQEAVIFETFEYLPEVLIKPLSILFKQDPGNETMHVWLVQNHQTINLFDAGWEIFYRIAGQCNLLWYSRCRLSRIGKRTLMRTHKSRELTWSRSSKFGPSDRVSRWPPEACGYIHPYQWCYCCDTNEWEIQNGPLPLKWKNNLILRRELPKNSGA